jgi:polar amino acid transport system substrate-binding protein
VPIIIGYPPYGYQDASGHQAGVDFDIARQLAKELNVKPTITAVAFENQLIGLDQGKYVYVPAINVTAARAKKYDFVSYINDGYSFLVKAGTTLGSTMDALCGKTVAVQAADASIAELTKDSQTVCQSAGKPKITLSVFPGQPAAVTALQSGRVDALTGEESGLDYLQQQKKSQFTVTGPTYLSAPLTLATIKGNGLDVYLQKAINAMIADGSYAAILKENNMTRNAITSAQINPGV